MKICFVVPDLNCGGVQRVTSELSNVLVSLGHEVAIVLLFKAEEPFYFLDSKVTYLMPAQKRSKNTFGLFKVMTDLRSTIKKVNPDVVIAFHHRYNPFVLLSLVFTGKKVFVSDRCNPYNKLHPFFNEWMREIMYPKAAGLLVQTNIAAQVKKHLNKNVYVFPNPIKQLKYTDNLNKEKIVISVGRFDVGKGQDNIIRIFSLVDKELRKDWKLVLVGDGPQRKKLEDLSRELNVSDRVEFLGARKDVDYLLSISEIFAFASQEEGYPNALLEGMGMGLACISYDCCAGPADLINDEENGFLVPLNDESLFVDRLSYLMCNENLRKEFGAKAAKVRDTNNIFRITNLLLNYITK